MNTEQQTRERVNNTPELSKHEATIFYNWNETDHLEWIATAPVAEIVAWAEAVEAEGEPESDLDEPKHTHGGPRVPGPGKRIGRPPTDDPKRDVRVTISMTAAQQDALQAAARAAGQTVSEYVRLKCSLEEEEK